jgi:hypothetical protein
VRLRQADELAKTPIEEKSGMSHNEGVHVHQPHEEMVEHGAHHDTLAQRVALTTAILATIGALFGYQAGQIANESMLLKNDSIAKKTEESDQWGYYQAKSTREFIAGSLSILATDDKTRDKLKADAERYGKEKDDIKKDADKLHAEALKLNEESEAKVAPHERIALGVTLLQVAVALASITVLTRKLWLFAGSLLFAAFGIGVAAWGYFAQ